MAKEAKKVADVVEETTSDTTEKVVDIQEIEAYNAALQAENETLKAEIATLEAKITELETQILELQTFELKNETSEISETSEPEKGVEFDFRDEKYAFSDDAPKNILFNGEAYSQEEISKDEEILLHLIGGNSSLIIKK